MISLLFSLQLLTSGSQLTSDVNELGKIFTHPGLHRLIQEVHSEPLGLYEPLHIGKSPFLVREIPRLRAAYAVRPDRETRVRGIGLLLNGALYQLTNSVDAPGHRQVVLWFHMAAVAREPRMRQNMLAMALFQLGRLVVVFDSGAGPRFRLEQVVKTLRGQETKGQGRIFTEMEDGKRLPWNNSPRPFPGKVVKIIISQPETGSISVLPWPKAEGRTDEYPPSLQ